MIKLSVLIPAYNPGKWLRKILDALAKQIGDYPQTEAIVVDDGSAEDLSYVEEYPFAKLIRTENKGEPSARNLLIESAKGQYVQFIDADDEIYPNALEIIYSNINKGYDFVSYEYHTDHDQKRAYHNYGQLMVNCAMWGYTFKRSFISPHLFDPKLLTGCDTDILGRMLKEDALHKHDTRVWYNYRWDGNENSLCHKYLRGEI